ncbi:outer membrane beta-barrel protein [Mucilaginibacter sp. HME9299]|uniref:Outer membrane beta-barrel protein n=2 Tax=Mucilaginibacter aquatilis TaxID=1517760 RepID=A0A6I4I5R4_9SPHI|nr:outer membrane beta-barrel protein [Mucilaginibacter aquatilis]
MKKIFFAAAFVLLIAGTADAQRRGYRKQRSSDDFYQPRVGLTGGLNIANTISSRNSDFSTDTKLGASFGLYIDIPIVYPLSFQPEILYSQKGYRANTIYGDFAQRANFIDVPILAKLRLAPSFNVVVGPQVSFLMNTRNTYYDGFDVIQQSKYTYNGDKTFVGGVVGVALDLNRNVELRGRYTIDFQENNPNGTSGVPDYRNQVWQVGLGFKF